MDKSELIELWKANCKKEEHRHGFSTNVMDLPVDKKSFLRLKKTIPKKGQDTPSGNAELSYFTEGKLHPLNYAISEAEYDDMKSTFEESLQ